MKSKNCPCCNEAISFKAFAKALFNFKKRNFAENEVGVLCPHCKKSIVSAERKNKFFIPLLSFALLPVLLIGLAWEILSEAPYNIYFASYFLLTLVVSFFLLVNTYKRIIFVCADESSDKYNRDTIYA